MDSVLNKNTKFYIAGVLFELCVTYVRQVCSNIITPFSDGVFVATNVGWFIFYGHGAYYNREIV